MELYQSESKKMSYRIIMLILLINVCLSVQKQNNEMHYFIKNLLNKLLIEYLSSNVCNMGLGWQSLC